MEEWCPYLLDGCGRGGVDNCPVDPKYEYERCDIYKTKIKEAKKYFGESNEEYRMPNRRR